MSEHEPVVRQPGRILALEPGLTIPAMREPIPAQQILLKEASMINL